MQLRRFAAFRAFREGWRAANPSWSGGVVGVEPPIPLPYLDHHIDNRIAFFGDLTREPNRSDALIDWRISQVAYFVPGADTWRSRPGPLPTLLDNDAGYRVRLSNLVVIGAFCQTFVSLNTMESANESARHGVNGILAQEARRHQDVNAPDHPPHGYERCMIWPLEDDEPADLDSMQAIDQSLFEKGQPHLLSRSGLLETLDLFFSRNVDNSQKNLTPETYGQDFKRFEDLWERITTVGRFQPLF